MGEVRTTFTSDDKEVQKSLTSMQKEIQKLIEANRKLKEEGKEAGKAQEDAFGAKALANVAGIVAGYFSASTAIQAVIGSMDDLKKRQDAARDQQLKTANPERAFMLNYLPGSPKEADAARKQVGEIAKQSNLTSGEIYQIAAPAVSATNSDKQLWEAVKTAAKVRPDNIEEASAIAGGLGDISKLTKSDNMESNLGLLLKMGKQARVEDLRSVSQSLVPGALGVKASGGTANEAVALVTALTKQSADATGASTGTASIQLANQLQEALPAMGSFDERLKFMVANEKEREKFLGKATFEQKAKAPIADLLRGGNAFELYKQNVAGDSSEKALQQNAGNILEAVNSQPTQKTGELVRGMGNISSEYLLGDSPAAQLSVMREGIQKFRSDVLGMTSVGGGFASARTDELQSMFYSPQAFAEAKINELRFAQKGIENSQAAGISPENKQRDEALERMIKKLEEIANNTGATKQNTNKKLNIDGNAE